MTSYPLSYQYLMQYREQLQLEERSQGTIEKYLRDVEQFIV